MFRLAISEAERSLEVAATLNANRSVDRNALPELLTEAQVAGILRDGAPPQMMQWFLAFGRGDLIVIGMLLAGNVNLSIGVGRCQSQRCEAMPLRTLPVPC